MTSELISSWASFGGELRVWEHQSEVVRCPMRYAVFEPPKLDDRPFSVLWYLSGLTCTWANVMEKSGIMAHAARHGLLIVAPDTSPRGEQVPDVDAYDLGQGAGFYLTATEEPYHRHFKMDSYLLNELNDEVRRGYQVDASRQGIMGHSMGGHGALTLHLKNPTLFTSCSALSPIVSPGTVPWGQKAFQAYLGERSTAWDAYDATSLVGTVPSQQTLLIDQGNEDPFLAEQLDPSQFLKACAASGQKVEHRFHAGYDHSYYFVASMLERHIAHHARNLIA
jgi:S-formylglutathione hydrolase